MTEDGREGRNTGRALIIIIMHLWSKNVYHIDIFFETLGVTGAHVPQHMTHWFTIRVTQAERHETGSNSGTNI